MNLEPIPTLDHRYIYSAIITRVIDGDTVVLDIDLGMGAWMHEVHCRLGGIDAPEIRGNERRHGLMAMEYLISISGFNGSVIIKTHRDKTGKYGRYIVDLWHDGTNLNQRMIDDGYAKARV